LNTKNNGILAKLMKMLAAIESNEIKATALSFLFVFILMAAYYLMRPLRDAMASDWTDAEVSWLWTLNFFISTILVALYGVAISRIPFKKLVPSVYAFFAASFVVFYLATLGSERPVLVDKSFYVWVSVFALFHVSVFWSFMADIFNKKQASRLFAIITKMGRIQFLDKFSPRLFRWEEERRNSSLSTIKLSETQDIHQCLSIKTWVS